MQYHNVTENNLKARERQFSQHLQPVEWRSAYVIRMQKLTKCNVLTASLNI